MKEIVRTFKLPELMTQANEDQVRGALGDAPGVGEFQFDLPNRQVIVHLTDPLGEEDVRRRLDHAGFHAER